MDFRSVEANLRESFRVLARHAVRGEVREFPGVSIASSGVAFQMFNAAFLSGQVSSDVELVQRISLANLHFDARGQEWAYWVCEDWMVSRTRRRSRQIFRKNDLHISVQLPGMVAERVLPPQRPLPELEIRRVSGEPTCAAFCAVGSICFNVPLAWFQEVFRGAKVWSEFAGFVGYVDGAPVCTAATVTSCGVVGVYNVGTVPEYQRRGYGEAIMRHALAVAKDEHGTGKTILQSTPAGYALYERMGYRTVTTVTVYAS